MHLISVIACILGSCYFRPLSFCVLMEMKTNHLCQLDVEVVDGKNEWKYYSWSEM